LWIRQEVQKLLHAKANLNKACIGGGGWCQANGPVDIAASKSISNFEHRISKSKGIRKPLRSFVFLCHAAGPDLLLLVLSETVLVLVLDHKSIDIESFVVKDWIGHLRLFEYEYRDAEYEYEKTQGRQCSSFESRQTTA
jgi:hypothetical protein